MAYTKFSLRRSKKKNSVSCFRSQHLQVKPERFYVRPTWENVLLAPILLSSCIRALLIMLFMVLCSADAYIFIATANILINVLNQCQFLVLYFEQVFTVVVRTGLCWCLVHVEFLNMCLKRIVHNCVSLKNIRLQIVQTSVFFLCRSKPIIVIAVLQLDGLCASVLSHAL